MLVMAAFIAASCKKDNTTDAQESVEVSKANLEAAGQQLETELNALANTQGVSAANNMVNCLEMSDPFADSPENTTFLTAVKSVSDYKTSADTNGFVNILKSLLENDTIVLLQVFDTNKGIYTWDITNKKWIKTSAADKIEMIFPSTETGTLNNATLTVTYKGTTGSSIFEGFNGNLPESISVILTVDNTKVVEYGFTGSYNSQSNPTSISTFLAVYPFKFEITLNNNTSTAASIRYLFTNNAQTVLDLYAGVNGNFDRIDDYDDPIDVIYNANAYAQVFNIKLAGRIDYKGLSPKVEEIDKNLTYTEEQRMQAHVDAMNKYTSLVLVYANSNQKIAQAKAFFVKNTKNYTIGNHEYSYTSYDWDYQLIFASGAPQSLDAYFGDSFTNLITDFNALTVKFNNMFDLGTNAIQ